MTDTRKPALPGDPSLRVIAIVGPTAVGKSGLAEKLAVQLGGEIVSADSMQIYRGMDIGTAKTPVSQRRVPYHTIDLVDPGDDFSAALFQRVARDAIRDIASRGRIPIVVGGTGLYLRAALDDMRFPTGETGTQTREALEELAREIGPEALHARLSQVDPDAADLIHPNNVRRTIRALEMAEEGTSYAEQASGFTERHSVYDTRFLGLSMDRADLYTRIDRRVDEMVANGLLDEVRTLLSADLRDALTAAQAIGYKEFVPVIDGCGDIDQAMAEVKQASRRYAKRQLTWFRSDSRIAWIDVTGMEPGDVLARALELLESGETPPLEPAENEGA